MNLDDISLEQVFMFLIIMIVLAIFSGIFCVSALKYRENENNKSPIRKEKVKLLSKESCGTLMGERAIFETESGERITVTPKEGNSLVVGDVGILTWQGVKILSFERER